MGVITNCCNNQVINSKSTISIYSFSESNFINDNNIYLDIIPNNLSFNSSLNFITSENYYILLTKNISKDTITKKICQKFNNSEIFGLINNLFQWIQKENIDNYEQFTKQKVNIIKTYVKLSLKNIFEDFKDFKFNMAIEIYLLQVLTSISSIVQCILFLKNNSNEKADAYKINVWIKKNILEEVKKYSLQSAYFLLLIKKKYSSKEKNVNNEKKGKKSTNEQKEEISHYYKLSIDFTDNLINS